MKSVKRWFGLRHCLCLIPKQLKATVGVNQRPLHLTWSSTSLTVNTTGACAFDPWTAFPVTYLRMSAISQHSRLTIVFTRQGAALAAGARTTMKRMTMKLWRHLMTNNHQFHLSLRAKSMFIHKYVYSCTMSVFSITRRGSKRYNYTPRTSHPQFSKMSKVSINFWTEFSPPDRTRYVYADILFRSINYKCNIFSWLTSLKWPLIAPSND